MYVKVKYIIVNTLLCFSNMDGTTKPCCFLFTVKPFHFQFSHSSPPLLNVTDLYIKTRVLAKTLQVSGPPPRVSVAADQLPCVDKQRDFWEIVLISWLARDQEDLPSGYVSRRTGKALRRSTDLCQTSPMYSRDKMRSGHNSTSIQKTQNQSMQLR